MKSKILISLLSLSFSMTSIWSEDSLKFRNNSSKG